MIFKCVFSWKHYEEAVAYAMGVSGLRLKKHIKWLTAAEVKALDITYADSDVSQEGWDHQSWFTDLELEVPDEKDITPGSS